MRDNTSFNAIKFLVSVALSTSSGLEGEPSSQAGPVKLARPPVAYLPFLSLSNIVDTYVPVVLTPAALRSASISFAFACCSFLLKPCPAALPISFHEIPSV